MHFKFNAHRYTTVQGILSAAGRWNEARRWARAAGSLVNNNTTLGLNEAKADEQGEDVCDVHAVTEAQAVALLVGQTPESG